MPLEETARKELRARFGGRCPLRRRRRIRCGRVSQSRAPTQCRAFAGPPTLSSRPSEGGGYRRGRCYLRRVRVLYGLTEHAGNAPDPGVSDSPPHDTRVRDGRRRPDLSQETSRDSAVIPVFASAGGDYWRGGVERRYSAGDEALHLGGGMGKRRTDLSPRDRPRRGDLLATDPRRPSTRCGDRSGIGRGGEEAFGTLEATTPTTGPFRARAIRAVSSPGPPGVAGVLARTTDGATTRARSRPQE